MSSQSEFKVFSAGTTEPGHESASVKQEFAKLFGISDEKADSYFSGKKLIRKGLTQEQALAYQNNLKKIGMATNIEPAIALAAVSNEPIINATPDTASDALSLLPADYDAEQSQTSGTLRVKSGFACPRCNVEQSKSEQCIDCGVFFSKLADTPDTNTAISNNDARSRAQVEDLASDDGGNIVVPIIAAAVASLFCAFAWKIIAIQTGYETGIVAWAIGGIVGYVAVMLGARGEVPAVACAILAVCAILGGKYMIEDYSLNNVNSLFAGELNEQLKAEYNEYSFELQTFEAIDKDDYSVKRYMSDYGYTNADSVTEISDEELQDFRAEMAFRIQTMAEMPDFDESISLIQAEYEAQMGNQSTFSYMIQNIGVLGAIFIFLGLSTAYRLVQANN